MTNRADVDAFLALKTLALAGASRGGRKFGNTILKDLLGKGRDVLPVHPHAELLDGVPTFPSLAALPRPVEGLVLVVPPPETERLVREAHAQGIRFIWMQQGSEAPGAIRFCEEHGMTVIHGECILMFEEPAGAIHRVHRWVKGKLGRLPKAAPR
jgi:uncharacterized protein